MEITDLTILFKGGRSRKSKGVLMPVSRELGLPLEISRELGFGSKKLTGIWGWLAINWDCQK